MKVCPACDREFDDDTLRFCLMDGTPLVDGGTIPTVAISAGQTAPTEVMQTSPSGYPVEPVARRKRSRLPWIIAGSIGMILVLAFCGWLISIVVKQGAATRADRSRDGNAAPIANISPKRPTPEPPAFNANAVSSDPVEDAADEVTPIAWSTSANTFSTETGRVYRFECPPDGTASIVIGNDVYAGFSSICTAAVHAGLITLEKGGDVAIELRPGRSIYGGTTRNGITSTPYAEYSSSFVFRSKVAGK